MKKITVIGLGKVGSLVGIMLKTSGFQVQGLDATNVALSFPTTSANVTDAKALDDALKGQDAVVSCLPYDLNIHVAEAANRAGIHYFDLTEDVATTNKIREMAKSSKGVMAPQCGLAPGFIGIVGAHLTRKFKKLRDIELRVGALPRHPSGQLGYAFNWSAEGVVNEYLEDCEVIKNGTRKLTPPMEGVEQLVIDGVVLEAFSTSGGLGTMCETFEGKVDLLNYKSIRYPGHCKLMRFFFNELLMKEKRKEAGDILIEAKPPVNDDVVYIHAGVEGYRQDDSVWREEFVRAYYPRIIEDTPWRAISWTTACSVAAVVEMVAAGTLPNQGFIKQEEIPYEDFIKTTNGGLYADEQPRRFALAA